MVRERVREADFAAAWAAGQWRGQIVRAEGGAAYLVLYEGRRGGGAGPDFRDAVLVRDDGARLYGDIELHLRPSGWQAHGHASDPRYDGLALHVVLSPPGGRTSEDLAQCETPLASGRRAPLVVLGALAPPRPRPCAPWPCALLDQQTLLPRLAQAGWARFERRVAAARLNLSSSVPCGASPWRPEDQAFWPELAEALGYGRDRALLRAFGTRLAKGTPREVLRAEAEGLPRVERDRVRGLLALATHWEGTGPVATLAARLRPDPMPTAPGASDGTIAFNADRTQRVDWEDDEVLVRLGQSLGRALEVPGGAVSPGRANIVVANVVLPFLAAWGMHSRQPRLTERARAIYRVLPGLPANTLTRTLSYQFALRRQPRGALAQQGLHEIWSLTCREKRCGKCLLGRAGESLVPARNAGAARKGERLRPMSPTPARDAPLCSPAGKARGAQPTTGNLPRRAD